MKTNEWGDYTGSACCGSSIMLIIDMLIPLLRLMMIAIIAAWPVVRVMMTAMIAVPPLRLERLLGLTR